MSKRARNPLDRRAEKLAGEMQRREGSVFSKLTDPAPAFQVRKSEMDALRDYLRVRAVPNGLFQLRDTYGDDAVDQYVAWGENALAKYLPDLMARGQLPDTAQDTDPEDTDDLFFGEDDEPDPFGVGADQNLFGPVSAEGM